MAKELQVLIHVSSMLLTILLCALVMPLHLTCANDLQEYLESLCHMCKEANRHYLTNDVCVIERLLLKLEDHGRLISALLRQTESVHNFHVTSNIYEQLIQVLSELYSALYQSTRHFQERLQVFQDRVQETPEDGLQVIRDGYGRPR